MGVGGNHEEEPDSEGIKFQAYEARFRYPYQESGSSSPHFYSFDVAGACSKAQNLRHDHSYPYKQRGASSCKSKKPGQLAAFLDLPVSLACP